MSTAINMFLTKCVKASSIPFKIEEPKPSKEVKKALKELDYILALSLCAYPFSTMAQTGWIATTTNYLWVVSLGLFVINQMLKVGILDEKISFIKLMLTYMAALYCASYETITIFLLVSPFVKILFLSAISLNFLM